MSLRSLIKEYVGAGIPGGLIYQYAQYAVTLMSTNDAPRAAAHGAWAELIRTGLTIGIATGEQANFEGYAMVAATYFASTALAKLHLERVKRGRDGFSTQTKTTVADLTPPKIHPSKLEDKL